LAEQDGFEPPVPVVRTEAAISWQFRFLHHYFADQLAAWVKELPAGQENDHFDALRDTILVGRCS
jgi:hypothetical protein